MARAPLALIGQEVGSYAPSLPIAFDRLPGDGMSLLQDPQAYLPLTS